MNRNLVITLVVVVAIGVAIFALTRPEPTPKERLAEAAEQAADAAEKAVDAVTDAATEAGEAVQKDLTETAKEIESEASEAMVALVEEVTAVSQETRGHLTDLIARWRETGIVTEDGIDFDAAIAAVEAGDLDAETKSQVTKMIEMLRDAPGEAKAKLEQLEAVLSR